MVREPVSRWQEWVNWVALTGGVLLGGLLGNVVNGAFYARAGFAMQLGVWSAVALGCGLAALFFTSWRLRRLETNR